MPDLLFLTQRLPYPPVRGDRIRPFHILSYLRQRYDIHLGCFVDDPVDWQYADHLRGLCRDTHFARLDRRRAKILCLRGLLTGEPVSVTYFRDRGLQAWVAGVLRQVKPAAIYVHSSNMAPYFLDHAPTPGMRRVVDMADVDSEKWREYAETGNPALRWLYRREWRRIAALERRIARDCDFSTFVSAPEAALFAGLAPKFAGKLRAISNGVDHRYFDPAGDYPPPYPAGPPSFVFTGVMDYPPNIDAVTWFATDILPRIRERAPDSRFFIVGSHPAPAVTELAQRPGVHVTGRVPDVRPYLAHATAAVAPMRIARGMQNKVLEAMAMAKPIIVTPAALTGITAEVGSEIVVAADPASFADAACRLAEGDAGARIGAAARRRVLADYSWEECLRGFAPLLAAEG